MDEWKLDRRKFIKAALAGAGAAALAGATPSSTSETGELSGRKRVAKEAQEAEGSAVELVGVTIPVDETNVTAMAVAIDTQKLGVSARDITGIKVEATEPRLIPHGVWPMDAAAIARQLALNISEPAEENNAGKIYIPVVGETLAGYEHLFKAAGMLTISARNELTGSNPSIPRDFAPGTTFEVTVEQQNGKTDVFGLGPWETK